MLKLISKFVLFFFVTNLPNYAQSDQQFADIGDLLLENGQTILNCRIGYRTFGAMNDDTSNVIIYPTWFGGTTAQLASLIGPDKLVSDSNYYVIAIDALGNGVSSSPNNSVEQPGDGFPEFNIRDMVRSQYILLTKVLDIKHLHGAIGGSMGSMQVFEWIVTYPDFIDKAVPYVCTPKSTANDLLSWNIRLEIIDSYKKLNADEKQIQKLLKMQSRMLARTPDYLAAKIDADNFENYLTEFNFEPNEVFNSDNYRSQLVAMLSQNIYSPYNNSKEEAASKIKTDVFMIISSTDHLLHPSTSLELAELINAKVLLLENDCGHLAVGCELERCGNEIRDFFNSH